MEKAKHFHINIGVEHGLFKLLHNLRAHLDNGCSLVSILGGIKKPIGVGDTLILYPSCDDKISHIGLRMMAKACSGNCREHQLIRNRRGCSGFMRYQILCVLRVMHPYWVDTDVVPVVQTGC
jgi:hypothetical protein